MDEIHEQLSQRLKERRWRQLAEYLASIRVKDKSDAVIVCGGEEFFAHKVVLQASGLYFQAMFNSGMEEAKNGKIVFQDVEAEILSAILDYVYLGEVENIETLEQTKKVMAAAHLMQLEELFQYCCDALLVMLSCENAIEIWDLCKQYSKQDMEVSVLHFCIHHVSELMVESEFLSLPFSQISEMFSFMTSKFWCVDKVLFAFFKWLQHDFEGRVKFVTEVFDNVSSNHVSKTCVQELLQDHEIMSLSESVSNHLNNLALKLFVTDDCIVPENLTFDVNPYCTTARITFFSTTYKGKEYDIVRGREIAKEQECNCVQQFALDTMTWLPVQNIPHDLRSVATKCQLGQEIFIVNGFEHSVWYNIATNTVTMGGYNDESFAESCGNAMCSFNGMLFVIGGLHTYDKDQVKYAKPDEDTDLKWKSGKKLKHKRNACILLTSSDRMYVVGGNQEKGDDGIIIEYSTGPSEHDWDIISLLSCDSLTEKNFFILNNTLNALYIVAGFTVNLWYNHKEKQMEVKKFPGYPKGVTQIVSVCQYYADSPSTNVVYVATNMAEKPIPDFLWNPEDGSWTKLPKPKGTSNIFGTSKVSWLYTFGL